MGRIKNTLVGLVAGLAVAGAAEVGGRANADTISTISSNTTYGDFNDDGQQDTRIVYTVSNNVVNDVHPYSDIPSWKLAAGQDRPLDRENVKFDLPTGWTYDLSANETIFSSTNESYNLPANGSLDFQITSWGESFPTQSVVSVAQNYWGNDLESYSVQTITPEPTTLGLLGLGGLAILLKRRKTKK